MNRCYLLGHVGKEPEVRNFENSSMTKFSVATNETFIDRSGNKQSKVTWHTIVCFGKLGEICAKYVVKGMQVLVEGKISNRTWDKDDGTKGYATEVVASQVQFVGEKRQEDSSQDSEEYPNFNSSDEIPF